MKQYAVAMTPTEGELCPLLRVGITADLTTVTLNPGEMIVEADLRGNTSRVRPGTWQSLKPFRWFCGKQWCTDDDSNHLHTYYLTMTNGEFAFVITEPPFISQTYATSQISASLTIT